MAYGCDNVTCVLICSSCSDSAVSSSLCNGSGGDDDAECIVCSDARAEVVFRPCGHRTVCVPCSVRMKKCIQCRAVISTKIGPGLSYIMHSSSDAHLSVTFQCS